MCKPNKYLVGECFQIKNSHVRCPSSLSLSPSVKFFCLFGMSFPCSTSEISDSELELCASSDVICKLRLRSREFFGLGLEISSWCRCFGRDLVHPGPSSGIASLLEWKCRSKLKMENEKRRTQYKYMKISLETSRVCPDKRESNECSLTRTLCTIYIYKHIYVNTDFETVNQQNIKSSFFSGKLLKQSSTWFYI